MVLELSLRLQHTCKFLEYSTFFGKKQVFHYCSNVNDYLIIPEKLSKDQEEFAKMFFGEMQHLKIKHMGEASLYTYIIYDCQCNNYQDTYIGQRIRKMGGTTVYPIIYQNGWEYYKIYVPDQITADTIIQTLDSEITVEILKIDDLGSDWLITQSAGINQVIGMLTPKQKQILIKAFEDGYYEIPRGTRTIDMAKELGKTRYAIERTLRSAENKIVKAIMPFVYLQESKAKIKAAVSDKLPMIVEEQILEA